MPVEEGIMVYDPPKIVDMGDWIVEHPECDFVMERLPDDWQNIRVFAYAVDKEHNDALLTYKENNLDDKRLVGGVPASGFYSVFVE